MTVPPKHLSSANGFTAPSSPSLVLPTLLPLISPSSPLLTSTRCSFHLTAVLLHACFFHLYLPALSHSLHPFISSRSSHLSFSSSPFCSLLFSPPFPQPLNLSFQRCFHYSLSLSVIPPTHPHTHTLSSYFPSSQAPFDLSKCSHRTSIDLCIQMCVSVWARMLPRSPFSKSHAR